MGVEDNILCVKATGSGKTECFIELTRMAREKGVRVAVLVGRDKLVSQTARRMRAVIDDVAVWSAGQDEKRISGVTVISIHSADNLTIPGLRLVICDEAHNLNDGRYAAFLGRHPGVKLVGFTATPWRNGVEIYGEGRRFSRIHYRRGLLKLIEEKFLVPPISKCAPHAFDTKGLEVRGDDFTAKALSNLVDDTGKIRAQLEDAMPRLVDRKKIVWICTDIKHAERVAKAIPENAALIHSQKENNDYAMECFEKGDVRHMVSVMMLSEGYDYPPIDAIVLMRPTRSPTLYVQVVGRGLRPAEGKKDCLVLDYGEVIKNCGPLHEPFTKEFREKSKKEKIEITTKVCPKCLSYVFQEWPCEDCGYKPEPQARDLTQSLKREASSVDILAAQPVRLRVLGVEAKKYTSAKGNACIRLNFKVEGRLWPISQFITSHVFSWRQGKKMIESLQPFEFDNFEECYEACEQLVFELPHGVEVKKDGKYERIERILSGAPDSRLPSEPQNRLLLEEY